MQRAPTYSRAHRPGQRLLDDVLARLRRDELTSTQIAERLRIAVHTAQGALRTLADAGLIERIDHDYQGIRWRALPAAEVTA